MKLFLLLYCHSYIFIPAEGSVSIIKNFLLVSNFPDNDCFVFLSLHVNLKMQLGIEKYNAWQMVCMHLRVNSKSIFWIYSGSQNEQTSEQKADLAHNHKKMTQKWYQLSFWHWIPSLQSFQTKTLECVVFLWLFPLSRVALSIMVLTLSNQF